MRSAAAAALLGLCAALLASAAPIADELPAIAEDGPMERAIFVRSCSDCVGEDAYCEFNHPDATPDAPLACVSHGTDHALYRRYEDLNCLSRPGISDKHYEGNLGVVVCYNFVVNASGVTFNQGQGPCPFGSGGGQKISTLFPTAITTSAPGAAVCMASYAPFIFGDNCNSVTQYSGLTCPAATSFVFNITVPFA